MEHKDETAVRPLIAFFENIIPLNPQEKQLVGEFFEPRLYRRRQYLLQQGDVCRCLNFVVRGCLRMYKVDEKGNIHIIQFSVEDNLISDISSLYNHTPSPFNIEALEDTMVLQISSQNLIKLYTQTPKFNLIFRVLIENTLVVMQDRLLQNISTSAQERYRMFLATYPHLPNRLPQTQIAAYLGITPEFLSKIKSELLRNGR